MTAAAALPTISSERLSLTVARACGAAAIVLCAAAVARLPTDGPWLGVAAVAGGVATAVLAGADVGAAATPAEAVLYAAIGALLAGGLTAPPLVVGLPLLVAVLDVISTLVVGPSHVLANAGTTQPGDPLSLELPDWGNGLPAGRIGLSDVVVAGLLLSYARRLPLRPVATAVCAWAAFAVAAALSVALDEAVPTLPLVVAAFLAANAGRLLALLRRPAAR